MIVAKCPLRISLVGGSTDLPSFIDECGRGAVISFPCNVFVYITIFTDKIGYNVHDSKYIVSYSSREIVTSPFGLKNNVARETILRFNAPPLNMTFNADIFSVGCGLASSSAYTIAAIKALDEFCSPRSQRRITNFEACGMAMEIERSFNPLVGFQDFYGCGIGGLKRIDFQKGKKPSVRYISSDVFDRVDAWLVFTEIIRSSTDLLRTLDRSKCKLMLDGVDAMEEILCDNDLDRFIALMRLSWEQKKATSRKVIENEKLVLLDQELSASARVLCHKLCGAGGGGYFLVFTELGKPVFGDSRDSNLTIKVTINESGSEVARV